MIDNRSCLALDELGVEAVATGVVDAPGRRPGRHQANVSDIAERFEAAGADTVLLVGTERRQLAHVMDDNPYRPKLLFLTCRAARVRDERGDHDTSILDGSLPAAATAPTRRARRTGDAGLHRIAGGGRRRDPAAGEFDARPVEPAVPGRLPGLPRLALMRPGSTPPARTSTTGRSRPRSTG